MCYSLQNVLETSSILDVTDDPPVANDSNETTPISMSHEGTVGSGEVTKNSLILAKLSQFLCKHV